jgi:hypothetical protein
MGPTQAPTQNFDPALPEAPHEATPFYALAVTGTIIVAGVLSGCAFLINNLESKAGRIREGTAILSDDIGRLEAAFKALLDRSRAHEKKMAFNVKVMTVLFGIVVTEFLVGVVLVLVKVRMLYF